MKAFLFAMPVVVASLFGAQAEEKVMKMKLVTKVQQEVAGGRQVFGVTFQPNGTAGTKDFFVKGSGNKGEFVGLSTYAFDDGTINASFTGTEYQPGWHKGTYVILAGSGKYEGAKGGGTFDGTNGATSPMKIGVYDVTLNVNLPAGQ